MKWRVPDQQVDKRKLDFNEARDDGVTAA